MKPTLSVGPWMATVSWSTGSLEGKPSAFDRVSLELLALLSPGPEWSTGYPELESDRTPLARVNLAPAHKRGPRARVTRAQNYLQSFLRLAALLRLGAC